MSASAAERNLNDFLLPPLGRVATIEACVVSAHEAAP